MPLVHQKGGQCVHLRRVLIVAPVGIAQQFVLFRNIPGLAAALAHQVPHILKVILLELSADDVLLPEAVGCAYGYMAEQCREQLLFRGGLAVLPVEDVHKIQLADGAVQMDCGHGIAVQQVIARLSLRVAFPFQLMKHLADLGGNRHDQILLRSIADKVAEILQQTALLRQGLFHLHRLPAFCRPPEQQESRLVDDVKKLLHAPRLPEGGAYRLHQRGLVHFGVALDIVILGQFFQLCRACFRQHRSNVGLPRFTQYHIALPYLNTACHSSPWRPMRFFIYLSAEPCSTLFSVAHFPKK